MRPLPSRTFLSEQQGHIDIDAFANQLANCRQTFRRARHLDHHIFAIHRLPQARPSSIVFCVSRASNGETSRLTNPSRNFETFINRLQRVGRILNVADSDFFIPRSRVQIGLRCNDFNMRHTTNFRRSLLEDGGFEVIPRRPSSAIIVFSFPVVIRSRRM